MRTRLLFAFLLLFTAATAFGKGGEIGNARYIPYRSLVGEFETQYPRTWSRLDIGGSVSFVEKIEGLDGSEPGDPRAADPVAKPSAVNLVAETFGEVRTIEDLGRYLRFFQFDRDWQEFTLAGRPGFRHVAEGKGVIYLLRAEGELLLIRYQVRASDELARQDIETILGSLRLY